MFSFFLKWCEDHFCGTWLPESAFWSACISAIAAPRTYPKGSRYHKQPPQACVLQVPISTGGPGVVTGCVHKAAALSHVHLRFLLQPEP